MAESKQGSKWYYLKWFPFLCDTSGDLLTYEISSRNDLSFRKSFSGVSTHFCDWKCNWIERYVILSNQTLSDFAQCRLYYKIYVKQSTSSASHVQTLQRTPESVLTNIRLFSPQNSLVRKTLQVNRQMLRSNLHDWISVGS